VKESDKRSNSKKRVNPKNNVKKGAKSNNSKKKKPTTKIVKKEVVKKKNNKPEIKKEKRTVVVEKSIKKENMKSISQKSKDASKEKEVVNNERVKKEELESKQERRATKREDREEKRERRRERRRKRRKIFRIIKLTLFVLNLYLVLNIYAITQLETDVTMESLQADLFSFNIDPMNLTVPDGSHNMIIELENPTWIPIIFPPVGVNVGQGDMKIIDAGVDWFRVKPKAVKDVEIKIEINYDEFLPLLLERTLNGEDIDKRAEIDLFLFNKKIYSFEQNIFG